MSLKYFSRFSVAMLLFFSAITVDKVSAFAGQPERNNITPALHDGSNYQEYWLQYFLFEDGAYLTTQFSIVNFPFNKHKAIMLSTLITPEGQRYIIKNGRGRSDWTYDPIGFNMTFSRDIRHNIQGSFPEYSLSLHNTMAEADLSLMSSLPPLNHDVIMTKKGKRMTASLYAPHFDAGGKWRLGTEANAPLNGPWRDFSKGEGFGLHVVMDGPIEQFMSNWIRVFGLKGDGGERIILSSILQGDGHRNSQLIVHNGDEITTKFKQIAVTVTKEQKDGKKSFPKLITIAAENETGKIEGTITFTKKLQHFRLNDHVSTLERLILSAFPSYTRYHYVAEYDLSYITAGGHQKISGKAMSEFTLVDSAKKKKKKRRHKR